MSELSDILSENIKRNKDLHDNGDQVTGKGIIGHTHRITIPGYPIRTQWITDETYNHPIYKAIKKFRSVTNMAKKNGVAINDVIKILMYVRCKTDPYFAFATCFFIMHKITGKLVPFVLNHAQHMLLRELENMRKEQIPIRLILLKARQWGGSTLTQLYMAWIQLFRKTGWNSVIIAQTKDTARRIKAMYRTALHEFPADLIGEESLTFTPKEGSLADSVIANSTGADLFDNTVTIASFENFEAARGAAFSMAHYSEVAYWIDTLGKTGAQVITSVDGGIALQPETLEVMESTANGMSGLFYEEYQKAKQGLSSYRALFIPFYYIEHDTIPFKSDEELIEFVQELIAHKDEVSPVDEASEPGRYLYQLWEKGATLEHINWYVHKRRGFHYHDQIASEAPSDDVECFRYSGANVFSQAAIIAQQHEFVCQPKWVGDIMGEKLENIRLVQNERGNLRIWSDPVPKGERDRYIVSVDTGGRGERSDYSVISVIDRWGLYNDGQMECVARWRGHLRYDQMAWKAVQIAIHYNDAVLVFESNSLDKKLADARELIQEGDHIRGILEEVEDYYDNLYYRKTTNQEDLVSGIVKKVGFQTNKRTKQDMVDCFTVMFEDGRYIDHDIRFYQEVSIYTQFSDGHYGNIPGANNHDDILMTVMIASLVNRELQEPKAIKEYKEYLQEPFKKETINESYF